MIAKPELSPKNKILVAVIIAVSIICFFLSTKLRNDINLFSKDPDDAQLNLIQDTAQSFKHILFPNPGTSPMISVPLNYFFIAVAALFLIGIFGFEASFIVGWAIAVIIFSVVSHGYAYYGIDFRLHRAILIFPVLVSLMVYEINKHVNKILKIKLLLYSLLIFSLVTGLQFQNNYLQAKPRNYHLELINWLNSNKIVPPNKTVHFIVQNPTTPSYISLYDSFQYFSSGHSTWLDAACVYAVDPNSVNIFIVQKDNPCINPADRKRLKLLLNLEGDIQVFK
jgi:hypothetical protein